MNHKRKIITILGAVAVMQILLSELTTYAYENNSALRCSFLSPRIFIQDGFFLNGYENVSALDTRGKQRLFSIDFTSGREESPDSMESRKQLIQGIEWTVVHDYGFVYGSLQEKERIYAGGCTTCGAVTVIGENERGEKVKGAAHLYMNEPTHIAFVIKLIDAIKAKGLQNTVVVFALSRKRNFTNEAETEKALLELSKNFTEKRIGFIGFVRSAEPAASAWVDNNSSNFDFYVQEGRFASQRNISFDDKRVRKLFQLADWQSPPAYLVSLQEIRSNSALNNPFLIKINEELNLPGGGRLPHNHEEHNLGTAHQNIETSI
ncbi:MAG: hypothetical protein KJ893_02040 [Candidatus Omnitrophica bacterium]|nr:hypothetical protein [Candidatus Omnitrophota bacterium]MBU4478404.1 hypothetical protein [Candidatus Omnitrophota bacterium]